MNVRALICSLVVLFVSCGPAPVSELSEEDIGDATERLRPALTEVEMDDFIEACLADNLVVVFQRAPTGEGFFGEAVTERDQAVMERCQKSLFDQYPNPPAPSTDAEFMVLYQLYLEQSACMAGLGLEVDVPSFEAYRDGNGAWTPFGGLPEPSSPGDWSRWNEACPQNPWSYDG